MATAAVMPSDAGILRGRRSLESIKCDVVIEKLFGIPPDAQACRVVVVCGASAHVTSFFPVHPDGTVDVMEAIPYMPKGRRSFNCWKNCQDCQFKIQIRFNNQGETMTTKSIGQCEVDLDRYLRSGKNEHLFCLPADSAPFESVVLPYIQVTLRPRQGGSSMKHITARPHSTSSNSEQLHNLQESIVTNFDADVTHKWKNKEQGRKSAPIGDRRARYAENWSRMNFASFESYDIVEKRISMETTENVAMLSSERSFGKFPKRCFSQPAVEEPRNSVPLRIAAMSTSTGNKDRRMEETAIREKELEQENRLLKASIARLESDLTLSRSETTCANARVSELSNELVTTKMKMDDGGRYPKRSMISRLGSHGDSKLSRQMSTTSDVIETSSRRSFLSRKSSVASTSSRSSSIKHETSGIPRMSGSANEELEAQKLALAEKLVQKEETIAKLEQQLSFNKTMLHQLEAGIDGVETRFDREIETFKLDVVRKYQAVFQKGQELLASSEKNEQGMDHLRKEIQKILTMIQQDIRTLEITVQKQEHQQSRLEDEKRIVQHNLEKKLRECEEAERYVGKLREEIEDWKSKNAELRDENRKLEKRVVFMTNCLADLTIDGTDTSKEDTHAEIKSLNERIASLKAGLAEYESKNRTLEDELSNVRGKLDQGTQNEHMDTMTKENADLKQELSEVSDKLADLEQENSGLKEEADQLASALNMCSTLEEEVQSLKKMNQEMEGHLSRKKKHIDELQGELKELRLKMHNHHTDLTFDSYASQETASCHVDSVLQAEQRYGDLEKILTNVQTERDQLLEEKSTQKKTVTSLTKENKSLSASLKKHQKQAVHLTTKLDETKAELTVLRERLQIKANSSNQGKPEEADFEIMQELVRSKVSLAEMDEKLIKLRRDHHKALARNVMLSAKTSRLESLLRELKQEKSGILRRKQSRSLRFV